MPKEMTYQESEEFVVGLLRERGPMTTGEIEEAARGAEKQCPDKTILVLTKLKAKGIIKGEFQLGMRTWKWWI